MSTNEVLYFQLLQDHLVETLPVVYDPAVDDPDGIQTVFQYGLSADGLDFDRRSRRAGDPWHRLLGCPTGWASLSASWLSTRRGPAFIRTG